MEKNVFRNITEHGLEKAGVPERADGVLLFVSHSEIHGFWSLADSASIRFLGVRRVYWLLLEAVPMIPSHNLTLWTFTTSPRPNGQSKLLMGQHQSIGSTLVPPLLLLPMEAHTISISSGAKIWYLMRNKSNTMTPGFLPSLPLHGFK